MKRIVIILAFLAVTVGLILYFSRPAPVPKPQASPESAEPVQPAAVTPAPQASEGEGEPEAQAAVAEGEAAVPAVTPPDALSLLDTAAKTLGGQESLAVEFKITVASFDETSLRESVIEGNLKTGVGNQTATYLSDKNTEISTINSGAERVVYLPRDKRYRKFPVIAKRHDLIASMMSGLLELPCIWLANLLDGAPQEVSNPAVLPGEYAGTACWEVSADTPSYSVRASLQKEAPHLPLKVAMALKPEAVNKYVKIPTSAAFTITTELKNWQLGVAHPADTFTFTPPQDAVEELAEAPLSKPAAQNGAPAPDFALDRLEGGTVQLKDHIGKNIVILDFFASWCGPCRRAMPLVAEVARKFADKGVVLYAVNQRETPEKIKAYLEKYGLSVPVLLDSRGQVGYLYQVTGLPRLVVIGKDGLIKAVHRGMTENIDAQLTREIEGLL